MHIALVKANSWLSKRFFYVPLAALLLGAVMPLEESVFLKKAIIYLFAYMTFVTALGSSLKRFFQVLGRPKIPLWILFLVHFLSPVVGWLLGIVFFPNDEIIRTGFLISSSIPIAVISTMWTSLAGGDVEVSFVAVTLDTFIGPIILPFFFLLVAGKLIHLNPLEMIIQLMFMVTIPCLIGMLVNEYSGLDLSGFAKGFGGLTSKIAMFFVIYINSSITMPKISWEPSMIKLLLVDLVLVSGGYALGFLGSFFLRERTMENISAMIFNVGMRNISFGVVVALTYFPPEVAIPVTLTMLFQQPVGGVVSVFFSPERRRRGRVESSSY